MDRWQHIEDLAKPTVPAGPSEILDDAIAASAREATALDAIRRWSTEKGGLPRNDSLDMRGRLGLFSLAQSAFDRAADARDLRAIGYLGHRLVAEGSAFADATEGLVWLQRVRSKADELGLVVAAARLPAFVRVVAAEAMFWYRVRAVLRSGATVEGLHASTRPKDLDDVLGYWEHVLCDATADEATNVTIERASRVATGPHRALVDMLEATAKRFAR